jgi:hypothetical protein
MAESQFMSVSDGDSLQHANGGQSASPGLNRRIEEMGRKLFPQSDVVNQTFPLFDGTHPDERLDFFR